ncbi:hypothetical protein ZTR_10079 [Talaromyces verruculosus]|nr:hypothetical protein ZTR_10079 [Talaromyces verruculosus]
MTVQGTSHEASSPVASEPGSSGADAEQPCSDHEGSSIIHHHRTFERPMFALRTPLSGPLQDQEGRSRRLWAMLTAIATGVEAVGELSRTIIRKDDTHIFELLGVPETTHLDYIKNYVQSGLRYLESQETAFEALGNRGSRLRSDGFGVGV